MIAGILFGFLPLAIWLYLLRGPRRFWQMNERDTRAEPPPPENWPSVVAVVPARNEADVIRASIGSLLAQDYHGELRVILVDDQSDDGTGELRPRAEFRKADCAEGRAAPAGLDRQALGDEQGVGHAADNSPRNFSGSPTPISPIAPTIFPGWWRGPKSGGKVLVSLMARLSCRTAAEHFLIPAFVFFFDMLFPFGAVNDPAAPNRRGGGRLHAGAAFGAGGGGRDRRHPAQHH